MIATAGLTMLSVCPPDVSRSVLRTERVLVPVAVRRPEGRVAVIDVDVSASCILGSIKQVLEQYLVQQDERDFDVARFARAILDYNLNGVLTR